MQLKRAFSLMSVLIIISMTGLLPVAAAPAASFTGKLSMTRRTEPSGWRVTDRMGFEVAGGRDGGFRWYSRKRTIAPGQWRVDVVTDRGQTLGRIDFTVLPRPAPPPSLETRIID